MVPSIKKNLNCNGPTGWLAAASAALLAILVALMKAAWTLACDGSAAGLCSVLRSGLESCVTSLRLGDTEITGDIVGYIMILSLSLYIYIIYTYLCMYIYIQYNIYVELELIPEVHSWVCLTNKGKNPKINWLIIIFQFNLLFGSIPYFEDTHVCKVVHCAGYRTQVNS
jgi:hypothetical protein